MALAKVALALVALAPWAKNEMDATCFLGLKIKQLPPAAEVVVLPRRSKEESCGDEVRLWMFVVHFVGNFPVHNICLALPST